MATLKELIFKPDAKKIVAWFKDLEVPIPLKERVSAAEYKKMKAEGRAKRSESRTSTRAARFKRLRNLEITEAELMRQAILASGLGVEGFMRKYLVDAAKTVMREVGSDKSDKKHASAFASLSKTGVVVTPTRLWMKAKTNYRSAKRWLRMNGHSTAPELVRKPKAKA